VYLAGWAAEDKVGGNILGTDQLVCALEAGHKRLAAAPWDLEDLTAGDPRDDCACARCLGPFAGAAGSPRKGRGTDATWTGARDGADASDAEERVSRYLSMWDGTRRHVASEGVAAAAGSRPAGHRDGGHDEDARRLTSECDALGRNR
jgi:hypothetical protein